MEAVVEIALYGVNPDYSERQVTLGLYIVNEVVDATVVGQYFGGDSGDVYEVEESAVSFTAAAVDHDKNSFLVENSYRPMGDP